MTSLILLINSPRDPKPLTGVGIATPKINPAVDALRRNYRVVARIPKSRLSLTAVIDLKPQTFYVSTTFVQIVPPPTATRLSPPTVLATPPTFLPSLSVYLAAPTEARNPRRAPGYDLAGPNIIAGKGKVKGGIGRVFVQPPMQARGAKPRLFPPTVTTAVVTPFVAAPVAVFLAYSVRGITIRRLFAPAVVTAAAAEGFSGPTVTLAPQKRGTPKSALRRPVDLVDRDDLGFVSVSLVRIRPTATHPRLVPPAVIDVRPQVFYLATSLAYSLRGKPKPILGKPADLVDRQDLGFVAVALAPSFRGTPKPRLQPPAVVAPVLARPIDTTFVRIRPVRTIAVVRKPTDLVDRDDLGSVRVHLAYSVRGKPIFQLFRPVVILPPPRVRGGTSISLVQPPRITQFVTARLFAPVVVNPFRPVARPPHVTLAPQRFGTPKSILRKPTRVAPVLAQPIAVSLAPQTRGTPKSVLRKPVVIDVRPQTYYLTTTLAYSVRGKPKSFLGRPTDLVDQQDLGFVATSLAYQSRRPGRVRLEPPAVIDLSPQTKYLAVTLTYSLRGKAKPFLGKPTDLVDKQDLGFVSVTLAYQSRGKTMSVLLPPTVVSAFLAAPINVTLVRRPTPSVVSRLIPPAVTAVPRAQHEAPIVFARIRPPRVHSLLKPPTVVALRENIPTATTLVRIRPAAVFSHLKPPTVVGGSVVFRPILTHLAYSSRGIPKSLLLPPASVRQCFGTVTGFDFAPSVCGFDEAAVVTGSDSTDHVVSGFDSGATVTGTSASGGTVTGGDTKREGC